MPWPVRPVPQRAARRGPVSLPEVARARGRRPRRIHPPGPSATAGPGARPPTPPDGPRPDPPRAHPAHPRPAPRAARTPVERPLVTRPPREGRGRPASLGTPGDRGSTRESRQLRRSPVRGRLPPHHRHAVRPVPAAHPPFRHLGGRPYGDL